MVLIFLFYSGAVILCVQTLAHLTLKCKMTTSHVEIYRYHDHFNAIYSCIRQVKVMYNPVSLYIESIFKIAFSTSLHCWSLNFGGCLELLCVCVYGVLMQWFESVGNIYVFLYCYIWQVKLLQAIWVIFTSNNKQSKFLQL